MAAKLNPCITEKQYFRAIVKNLSRLEPIRNIKSKLNPSQLKRFEASCFGRVFLMSTDLEFSSQIIHHLLLRQADHPCNNNEMWFVIGGKTARFSLYEFALITGLNCGEYPSPAQLEGTTQSTRLRDKYFDGQKGIDVKCLQQRFLSCVDEEDVFRLSLLYFLQAVLLSRDMTTKMDGRWLSLVDDLESFNKFPWGKLCYELTTNYLKKPIKAKLKKDLNTKKFESKHEEFFYHLGGFPYAFQVWAYEVIPILARRYAMKKASLIPRILCWDSSARTNYKILHKDVFSSQNLDVLKTLRATELESEQDYVKSIANFNYTLEDMDGEDVDTKPSHVLEKSPDSAETKDMARDLNHHIAKKQFSPISVINFSSLKAIRIINGKLNPSQEERFEASCFGKLLCMPTNVELSLRIIHQLCSSQADHPAEEEIWFAIGGERVRFSQYEFALITGLNCGQYPTCTELMATTRSTRLRDKYFDGRNSVFTECLKQQFVSCTDEDDTFKLAMVYFLETVLLGRCPWSSIDQRWLSLIDDVEAFNSFAWGKLSYERTLRSLRTPGKATLTHDMKKSHRLSGFPYAFQVWAYETMPIVARKYAEKRTNLIPRVLRWSRKNPAKYKEADKNIFSVKNVEVVKTMEASEFESKQDYMKSIVEFTTRMLEEEDEDCEDDVMLQHYGMEKYTDSTETVGKKKRKTRRRAGKGGVNKEERNDDEKRSEVMSGVYWSRGNGKRTSRKRRKMPSYIPFPFSEPLKKQMLVDGETVILSPIRKTDSKDVNDLLEWLTGFQNNTGCLQAFVNDCLRQHDSFIDNGEISMETEQEQQRRVSITKKKSQNEPSRLVQEVKKFEFDAYVRDQPPGNSNLLSMGLLEQLDAILQHDLDLDFFGKEPPTQPEAELPTNNEWLN